MNRVASYSKAVLGFITPGVVGLVAAAQNASPGHSAITQQEWIGIGAACVLTAAGVYVVPNRGAAKTEKARRNAKTGRYQ